MDKNELARRIRDGETGALDEWHQGHPDGVLYLSGEDVNARYIKPKCYNVVMKIPTETAHTILITGGREGERREHAQELTARLTGVEKFDISPDYLGIDTDENRDSIGIETARTIKGWVRTKPIAKAKVVYIHNAQNLTPEAQNALLKTLEEPPQGTHIILSTPHKRLLFPTVVSRCQVIKLQSGFDMEIDDNLTAGSSTIIKLLKSGLGERVDWVAENKNFTKSKAEQLQLLNLWLTILREVLLVSQNPKTAHLLLNNRDDTSRTASLYSTEDWLRATELTMNALKLTRDTNADRRLILEVLLLHLPEISDG